VSRSRAPKLRRSGLGDRLAQKGYSFEIAVRVGGECGSRGMVCVSWYGMACFVLVWAVVWCCGMCCGVLCCAVLCCAVLCGWPPGGREGVETQPCPTLFHLNSACHNCCCCCWTAGGGGGGGAGSAGVAPAPPPAAVCAAWPCGATAAAQQGECMRGGQGVGMGRSSAASNELSKWALGHLVAALTASVPAAGMVAPAPAVAAAQTQICVYVLLHTHIRPLPLVRVPACVCVCRSKRRARAGWYKVL
jgi:hypothetical protein